MGESAGKIIAAILLGLQIPVCVGLGVLFLHGKGADLVIHTERERIRTNVPELLRFMAKLMFAMAACWIPFVLGVLLWKPLTFIGLGLFLAVTIGGVIYMNTAKRFRKW